MKLHPAGYRPDLPTISVLRYGPARDPRTGRVDLGARQPLPAAQQPRLMAAIDKLITKRK